jgi:CDP-glycerol glycerophosphotransferase (TagB/SpsB family)
MSFEALTRLLGLWGRDDVVFLFRAHPRDTTQQQGRYGPLLEKSSLRVLDVSYHTDSLALYCGADLVATQFSSAAVEASHMGIPALFVLFDDLGKEYLRKNKGYEELPWTQQGCSFLIEDEDQVANVMDRALFDQAARDEVLANFQNRYRHVAASAPAIMNRIRTITGRIIQTGDSQRLPTQRQF